MGITSSTDASGQQNHGHTRPRPNHRMNPAAGSGFFNMEENHADLLDHYHRESHADTKDESINDQKQRANGTHHLPLGVVNDENISNSQIDRQPATTELARLQDEFMLSETPDCVAKEFSISMERVNEGLNSSVASASSSSVMHRCSSVERRMNETARFYEALGETPPSSRGDIQEIIEDDGDDDDDEEEEDQKKTEIRVVTSSEDGPSFKVAEESALGDSNQAQLLVTALQRNPLFMHSLPGEVRTQEFQYKGIKSNPPEITKRGISRGNYALLHRKAWLEVSDPKHRYGKNLRLYYRHWESLDHPAINFFDWLDSKGAAEGLPVPELEECPRSRLDSDTVLYIQDSEMSKQYQLFIETDEAGKGRVLDIRGELVETGPDGWIFVLRDNELFGAKKITCVTDTSKQRFHHSSFFGGKAVAAAGVLKTDKQGILVQVYPHSGHYRPGEADMQRFLLFLHNEGINLRTFEVDTQQLDHINRNDPKGGAKKAKVDSLKLKPAIAVAHYLSHKARCIGDGIFDQIETLRGFEYQSVREALDHIEDTGAEP